MFEYYKGFIMLNDQQLVLTVRLAGTMISDRVTGFVKTYVYTGFYLSRIHGDRET